MKEIQNICSLCSLLKGEGGTVIGINTKGDMRRRFMDMGLIAGTMVSCMLKSAKGDISAYLIRGALIAIRCEDASEILVKK